MNDTPNRPLVLGLTLFSMLLLIPGLFLPVLTIRGVLTRDSRPVGREGQILAEQLRGLFSQFDAATHLRIHVTDASLFRERHAPRHREGVHRWDPR